jgi:hypothetical protein
LKRINEEENMPFVFYLHPWELDHAQPRIVGAGIKSRVRHYLNLDKTEGRLRRLLGDFSFGTIREFQLRLTHAEGLSGVSTVVQNAFVSG